MSRVLLLGLALGAVLLQLGAVPALFGTAAAPLLPVALLAAWGSVRPANEVWGALLVTPVALGLASEQRVGWFMLALLPTAALLLAAPPADGTRRLGRASLAAGAGALCYLVLLTLAGGRPGELAAASGAITRASLGTALLASAAALALSPLASRQRAGLH